MKATAKLYRGIEFVSLNELPVDQQLLLQHNADVDRIKILIENRIMSNCIQYADYVGWYSSVFEKSVDHALVNTHKTVDERVFQPATVFE